MTSWIGIHTLCRLRIRGKTLERANRESNLCLNLVWLNVTSRKYRFLVNTVEDDVYFEGTDSSFVQFSFSFFCFFEIIIVLGTYVKCYKLML